MDVGEFGCDTNDTFGDGARCVAIWRALSRKQRLIAISKIHKGLWTALGIMDPNIDQMYMTSFVGTVFGTNSK